MPSGRALPLALALCVLAPAPALAVWGASGIPATRAPLSQDHPCAVPDGAGGLLVTWLDGRMGYNIDVYAQRILPAGAVAAGWPANGAGLTCVTCKKYDLVTTTDGVGGVIAAWSDIRCPTGPPLKIYAQRMLASGGRDPGWPANGAALGGAPGTPGNQTDPAIAVDGAGGAFVTWNDTRHGPVDLYATRVLASGATAPGWPLDGLQIATATCDTSPAALVADDAGGMLVAWVARGVSGDTIRIQRLTGDGTVAEGWPAEGLGVCALSGGRASLSAVPDGAGGAVLVWVDFRGPDGDLFAARVAAAGALAPGWSGGGNLVCGAGGEPLGPVPVAGDSGDVFVAWSDRRDPGAGSDLYVQHLDASGAVHEGWPSDGLAACAAPEDQSMPALAADQAGGVLLAWVDAREQTSSGLDIYVQRLTAAGARASGWPSDGLALCRFASDQTSPRIVADGSGGALATWVDARNQASSGLDIYVGRVGSGGSLLTQVRDLTAVHHDGQTFLTWTGPATTGYTYRAYASDRPIQSPADLTGARFLGVVADSSWCDLRLSHYSGTIYPYAVDSLTPPLDSTRALFVRTAAASGSVYYAATAQAVKCEEDVTIRPGVNALVDPVTELVGTPRPVFQRTVLANRQPTAVYTLWTDSTSTPGFPAMTNRPSMAFDCAVRQGQPPDRSLLVRPATRKAYFLEVISWTPGYWLLAFDDPLPSGEGTFYYGYHTGYDVTVSRQTPPTTGLVCDYTSRRMVYLLRWARRTFPIDTARVYTMGYSAAGSGAAMLTFAAPELIAGTLCGLGKYDFSVVDEADSTCQFNTGNVLRTISNELWGTVQTDLPTTCGLPVFDRLNLGFMAGHQEPVAVPLLVSTDGRRDNVLGWTEKVDFYRAMQLHRQGGYFFWDERDHYASGAVWSPMENLNYLWRFCTNRSFPALSNCSADDDPGNGAPDSGDLVGTINGFVEWDTTLVDEWDRWQTTLNLRDLLTVTGTIHAPESLTVDVTPRRLQRFGSVPGEPCAYRVVRTGDGAVVQSGNVLPDSIGRLTVTAVKVYRAGSRLELDYSRLLDACPPATPRLLALALTRNPVVGRADLVLVWPAAGDGRVDLLDVSGRLVRVLWRGPAQEGPARLALETTGLPSGLYFVQARTDQERLVRRIILLR